MIVACILGKHERHRWNELSLCTFLFSARMLEGCQALPGQGFQSLLLYRDFLYQLFASQFLILVFFITCGMKQYQ